MEVKKQEDEVINKINDNLLRNEENDKICIGVLKYVGTQVSINDIFFYGGNVTSNQQILF